MNWVKLPMPRLRDLVLRRQRSSFPDVKIPATATLRLVCDIDKIGAGSCLGDYCELSSLGGGTIMIGERCEIGRGAMIMTYGGNISIGNDCSINPYSIVYGHGGLTIGNYVRIAAHSVIIPANHNFGQIDIPICKQGLTKEGIVIEDDVWIGARVVITDGVRIGKGAVIGAGAVVTTDIESYSVCAGVPARTIGHRNEGVIAKDNPRELAF